MSNELQSMLETATIAFINNTQYNDYSSKVPLVSKIFDWYGEDFGDVAQYISKYLKLKRAPFQKIEFKDYNWELNQQ